MCQLLSWAFQIGLILRLFGFWEPSQKHMSRAHRNTSLTFMRERQQCRPALNEADDRKPLARSHGQEQGARAGMDSVGDRGRRELR